MTQPPPNMDQVMLDVPPSDDLFDDNPELVAALNAQNDALAHHDDANFRQTDRLLKQILAKYPSPWKAFLDEKAKKRAALSMDLTNKTSYLKSLQEHKAAGTFPKHIDHGVKLVGATHLDLDDVQTRFKREMLDKAIAAEQERIAKISEKINAFTGELYNDLKKVADGIQEFDFGDSAAAFSTHALNFYVTETAKTVAWQYRLKMLKDQEEKERKRAAAAKAKQDRQEENERVVTVEELKKELARLKPSKPKNVKPVTKKPSTNAQQKPAAGKRKKQHGAKPKQQGSRPARR